TPTASESWTGSNGWRYGSGTGGRPTCGQPPAACSAEAWADPACSGRWTKYSRRPRARASYDADWTPPDRQRSQAVSDQHALAQGLQGRPVHTQPFGHIGVQAHIGIVDLLEGDMQVLGTHPCHGHDVLPIQPAVLRQQPHPLLSVGLAGVALHVVADDGLASHPQQGEQQCRTPSGTVLSGAAVEDQ